MACREKMQIANRHWETIVHTHTHSSPVRHILSLLAVKSDVSSWFPSLCNSVYFSLIFEGGPHSGINKRMHHPFSGFLYHSPCVCVWNESLHAWLGVEHILSCAQTSIKPHRKHTLFRCSLRCKWSLWNCSFGQLALTLAVIFTSVSELPSLPSFCSVSIPLPLSTFPH